MRYPANIYQLILSIVVIVLVPVILALGVVRLILNPWYLDFIYSTPNFPSDPYGFTRQDRLRYSRIDLDYLLNNAGISFLGDLRFPAGQEAPPQSCLEMTDCTQLYNQRELKHMVDVKSTLQTALKVWYLSIGLFILIGVLAWRGNWLGAFTRSLSRGGWLTILLIAIVLLFVLGAFDIFFVFFHNLFFQAGTWTFYFSDTLIRLFPERFWQITFTFVGTVTAVAGLILALVFRNR